MFHTKAVHILPEIDKCLVGRGTHSTVEPRYNEDLWTIKIILLYDEVSRYIGKKQRNITELGPARLPCYKRVLLCSSSL